MWAFFVAPENGAFTFALALVLLIGLVEAVSLLVAGGLFSHMESLFDFDGFDGEVGLDNLKGFQGILAWLYIGRAPLSVVIVGMLGAYSLSGYFLQMVFHALTGSLLPFWLAFAGAWMLFFPCYRLCMKLVLMLLPKDETSAVSELSLIGRTGVVVFGTATEQRVAQVKVKDSLGGTHYVNAFADDGKTLTEGSEVLLVGQKKSGFYLIIARPSERSGLGYL